MFPKQSENGEVIEASHVPEPSSIHLLTTTVSGGLLSPLSLPAYPTFHIMLPQLPTLLLFLVLGTLHSVDAVSVPTRRSSSRCKAFASDFASSDVSRSQNTPFQAVSPEGSYSAGNEGLKLFLEKPQGKVYTKDGVNNVVAEGATVNSTFYIQYVSLFVYELLMQILC